MNPRSIALQTIQSRPANPPLDTHLSPSEIFRSNVFDKKAMKHYLSKEVYLELKQCMEQGQTLKREIAGPVANAIKAWAIDKGASHFTHWFQPLTGLAAEKHDSFMELESDGNVIDKFSGDELAQQEPDASSFPHGGLRSTFEARGYTAWDSSSPVFIFETTYGKTLCIPTIFVSYTGEALDHKIPLLKSIGLLDQAATAVCQYFDPDITRVTPTLGAEQEYFLVDEAYYLLRPDLMLTGRSLFGALPAKGQQLDDHYFGSIPERAFAFMNELERDAHKLGIPLRTRHNEVAPGQYECAPQYEELNVAVDHGQMLMDLIERTARKHSFRALMHEKPFAGINGSGKHNNWSMSTNTGKNLLSPGSEPEENLMFLAFFTTVIRAVHAYADLLRAAIASAGNDHRLGANEAPPAIISTFIGQQLSKVLDDIVRPPRKKRNAKPNPWLQLGISKIPELFLDNTDRNRTSPFAFTGNKFEFRAVGSSANSAQPMCILNLIVAEQLRDLKKRVDAKVNRGRDLHAAMLDVVKENIKASEAVRFEGDGYSDAWVKEAANRGLSNIKNTPDALKAYLSKKSIKLFTSTGIFTEAEALARYEVMMENYLHKVRIEADVATDLSLTAILPIALRYQSELVANIKTSRDLGLKKSATQAQHSLVEQLGTHINAIVKLADQATLARQKAEKQKNHTAIAKAYSSTILPLTAKLRKHVDALEMLVPDVEWPLPKYRELLFVK